MNQSNPPNDQQSATSNSPAVDSSQQTSEPQSSVESTQQSTEETVNSPAEQTAPVESDSPACPSEPEGVPVSQDIRAYGFVPSVELESVRNAIQLFRSRESWDRERISQLAIEISWFTGCGATLFGGGEPPIAQADGKPIDVRAMRNSDLIQLVESELPKSDAAGISPDQWMKIALALWELWKRFS